MSDETTGVAENVVASTKVEEGATASLVVSEPKEKAEPSEIDESRFDVFPIRNENVEAYIRKHGAPSHTFTDEEHKDSLMMVYPKDVVDEDAEGVPSKGSFVSHYAGRGGRGVGTTVAGAGRARQASPPRTGVTRAELSEEATAEDRAKELKKAQKARDKNRKVPEAARASGEK